MKVSSLINVLLKSFSNLCRQELSFWLFLLNQGPGKRDWFDSWEFRIWYLGKILPSLTWVSYSAPLICNIGSIIAVLGMPLTTLVSRNEIETVRDSSTVIGVLKLIFYRYNCGFFWLALVQGLSRQYAFSMFSFASQDLFCMSRTEALNQTSWLDSQPFTR